MTRLFVLLSLLLIAAPVSGQSLPLDRLTPYLPTTAERRAADVASWVTVGTLVALDTVDSWQTPNRGRAFIRQGARIGVTYLAMSVIKPLVHRDRPCTTERFDCGGSVDYSFYSGHTAMAFQALGGPRFAIAFPLAIGTGGLRVAAGKHYLTDVLVGAGAGYLASRIR